MSDQKKHWYIVHGSFKNPNLEHDLDQSFNGDFSLSSSKITKSTLEKVRLSLVDFLCTRQISQNPYPIRILPS